MLLYHRLHLIVIGSNRTDLLGQNRGPLLGREGLKLAILEQEGQSVLN